MTLLKRGLSGLLLISIVLNNFLLLTPQAYGEEATASAQIEAISPTPTQSEEIITPTPESTASATPTIEVSPTATPAIENSTQPATATRSASLRPAKTNKTDKQTFRDGEVIVKFKEDKIDLKKNNGEKKAEDFADAQNMEVIETIEKGNIAVLEATDNKSVEELVTTLKADPHVAYAEPNYFFTPANIPSNDPYNGTLWGFENLGQLVNGVGGTVDADMDIPEAWGISEGNNEIIVAVIDTGVAYSHPDLQVAMWDGTSCKDENGNSLGQCKHGYDFEDNDNDPFPTYSSHGTHVAGTIAAAKNNGQGITGVAPKVKIMALKTSFAYDETVRAIDFAIQNGAKIINASYGGGAYSQANYDAISRFQASGGIFVAAAHNYSSNNDLTPLYPASFNLDNIIAVAATDQNDNLASFSNYGATSVDVGAPGVNIFSTIVNFSSDPINVLFETFNNLTPPDVPSGWTKTGNWETWDTQNDGWGNVLFADTSFPYSSNSNSPITLPKFDLNDAETATVGFWASCDVRYSTGAYYDYMAFEVSNNSNFSNFTELRKWDEFDLDTDNNPNNNVTPPVEYQLIDVPSDYLKTNTYFRFRWITDSIDNNYEGCMVDDVEIFKTTPGVSYSYEASNGTSMATPNTAGLVGLIWSYKANLTATQVKSLVLNTGDAKPALTGKTLTGKRINAHKALLAATTPTVTGLSNDTTPTKSKTWTWSSSDPNATYRHIITTSPIIPAGGGGWYGGEFTAVNTATQPNGTGTYYLHVQAKNSGGIESEIVTVSAILDNTAPILSGTPTATPSAEGFSNSTTQTWTWEKATDTVSTTIEYVWTIINTTTSEVVAQGTTTLTSVVINLTEGVYSFFVKAKDTAGNESDPAIKKLIVDTTNPTAAITSPMPGQTYNTIPDFTVSATDLYGIQSVQFQYKTAEEETFKNLSTDFISPYQGDWDSVTLVSHKWYDLQAVITDYAGNKITITEVSFFYDTTGPSAPVITSPTNAVFVNADTYTITGTAEKGSLVRLYKDGVLVGSQQLGQNESVFTFVPSLEQNAINSFVITAFDSGDNKSTPVQVPAITEDSILPAINNFAVDKTTFSPGVTQGINDSSTLDLEFSEEVALDIDILDNQSNKIRDLYNVPATSSAKQAWDGKNNAGSFVTDGAYTIKIAIVDKAGNKFTDNSKTVTIDTDLLALNAISNKSIAEESTLTFTVSASHEEGESVNYSLVNNPAGSTISTSTGVFTFTPNEAQGPNTYTFSVLAKTSDMTKSQNVTVSVTEINQAPGASNILTSTNEDTSKVISLIGEDSDLPANILTYAIVTQSGNGTVSLQGNQATYTPNNNFYGTDVFTYRVYDGTLYSNTASIIVTVQPVNDAPIALSSLVTVDEDTSKSITLSATDLDEDTLTYSITSQPTKGILSSLSNNTTTYTPNINISGTDSFTFIVTDAFGQASLPATVTLSINPVNDQPVAITDIATTTKNAVITLNPNTLISNDTDIENDSLSFAGVNNPLSGTVSLENGVILFTPNQDFVGIASFNYSVTDGQLTAAGLVRITVTPPVEVNQVVLAPVFTVAPSAPEIVVSPTAFDSTITIPSTVENATLDVSSISTTTGETKSAVIENNITVNASTSVGIIKLEMPSGIEITGPVSSWTGDINVPKVLSNTTVAIAPSTPSVQTTTTSVIEVGFGDVPLTFNKAVRLVIPGQAGTLVGYSRGNTFTPITTVCTADTQAVGDALPSEGDCAISVGTDLIIWTKHFTKFVTYTQTTQSSSTTTTTTNSNTTSNSTAAPANCTATKPGRPSLLSAVASGNNEVTLTWTGVKDAFTHYLVTYGTAPGLQEYGNPHIDKNTTSYTIKGLSAEQTYYFKVRAGNSCTPGDFSNELFADTTGNILSEPAEDFEEGILGLYTDDEEQKPLTVVEEVKAVAQEVFTPQPINRIDSIRAWGVKGFAGAMMLPVIAALAIGFYQRRKYNSL